MHDPKLIAQIKSYLKANEGKFTLDALRAQLVRDGAPADAVDQAMAELYGGPSGQPSGQDPQPASPYLGPPPAPPPSNTTRFSALVFCLWTVATVLVNIGAFVLAIWVTVSVRNSDDPVMFALALYGAAEVILIIVLYVKRRNAIATGLLVGMILSPFILFLVLFGLCVAVFSNYR